jgi:microcystin-dependent protein
VSLPLHAQDQFIGELALVPYNFAPVGWAFCQGQLLSITENSALFNLIGTTYGGDGVTTFALPDLRGRVPIGRGQGLGLSNYVLAQTGGVENVTLTTSQMPVHSHVLNADTSIGSSERPTALLYARDGSGIPVYGSTLNATAPATAVQQAGGSQPHNNIKPYVTFHWIISLTGIYPAQLVGNEKR